VGTEETGMNHFEQELKEEVKQTIARRTYVNFQEMYQRAMKVACVLNVIEIENSEKG